MFYNFSFAEWLIHRKSPVGVFYGAVRGGSKCSIYVIGGWKLE
jgi:hypothetical protein